MYYVRLSSRDIRQNLATEHYLLNKKTFDEPVILFYIQEPCVIVGRNQNVRAEVDLSYAKEQHITVTRRLSGGGAVYDDLGNLSFSFVVDADHEAFGNFKLFTQPILTALHKMGATGAQVSGRNDLLIEGKKFSGNAMYIKNKKMYSHGTLMLDVDLEEVSKVLTVSKKKLASKGTKSVRSRVTNLKPYLAKDFQDISTEEFRDRLLLYLFNAKTMDEISENEYNLTDADQQVITQLVNEIYGNEQWIYGDEPIFTIQREEKFAGGLLEANIAVEQGVIQAIKIYGDYFSQRETAELEKRLIGCFYLRKAIEKRIEEIEIDLYFKNISKNEFVNLLVE